ncbi:LytR C-terminal domain-containing protein [Phytoactinopolyspora mesophila]|nr:LytR C-terminal domain-containing protein [Phytoactinopolyspora mesophila]
MRERLDRAWPSLVALLGTVGVVLVLLFIFGDNTGDGTGDDLGDIVVGDDPEFEEDPADEDDEPTGEPTDPADPEADESGEDAGESGDENENGEEPDPEPTTAPPELRSPVGIANQTAVQGLELRAQERLEAGGWEVAATSGFEGNVPATTVYYPPGMEEQAQALSRQFPEIGRVEPTFEGVNQTRLVIVLVEDYSDVVDG